MQLHETARPETARANKQANKRGLKQRWIYLRVWPIIRIAKQFPGRYWFHYDRAYRLETAASNSKNWSKIHADLYHYHTAVAVKATQPLASRNREPRVNQNSMIACKSWNSGACSSSRDFCRFRHRCDRDGCGGAHRRIQCSEFALKRGLSLGDESSRRRNAIRRDGVVDHNIFSGML